VDHEAEGKAASIRHLPMKKDEWLYGIRKDEMDDLLDVSGAPLGLTLATSFFSVGAGALITTLFAPTKEPWMWVLGGLLLFFGICMGFFTRKELGTAKKILNRIRERYQSEEEILPLGITSNTSQNPKTEAEFGE
jgi:cytochrome c biogenesis protein CcdA